MSPLGALGGTLGGGVLGGVSPLGGLLSGAASSTAGFVLQGVASWVLGATRSAIEEVAGMIGQATAPNLESTWFSATYWRVAALAAMLTIPFLCAAAVQAVARADLSLLGRVAFGYLPLSILGVSLAAPLTMLALAATDQMSAAVSASAATGGARFLDLAARAAGTMAAVGGSTFFGVIVGLLAMLAALALAVELLVRAAAVYVVVLMLPLAFAALVWPARRVWAARVVELLASLILSKFVIVAVLSLAGAAFAGGTPGIKQLLVAMALIMLATFAPWALLRILPFTELAAGAAGILRSELPHAGAPRAKAEQLARSGAGELSARLREQARSAYAETGGEPAAPTYREMGKQPGAANYADAGAGSEPAGYATPQSDAPTAGATGATGVRDDRAGTSETPASSTYVLPHAWRGREQIVLDDQRLRPPATTPDAAEEQG